MKSIEVVRHMVKPHEVEDKTIEVAMYLNDATDSTDNKILAKVAIELLVQMLPLSSVSEGGVSLSYDTSVKDRIYFLCNKYGFSASYFLKPKATITRL